MTPDEMESLIASRSASAPCTPSSSEMVRSPGENLWLDGPGLAARLTT